MGDLNGDGIRNIHDVILMANMIVWLIPTVREADLNFDGVVNILDLICLILEILWNK